MGGAAFFVLRFSPVLIGFQGLVSRIAVIVTLGVGQFCPRAKAKPSKRTRLALEGGDLCMISAQRQDAAARKR